MFKTLFPSYRINTTDDVTIGLLSAINAAALTYLSFIISSIDFNVSIEILLILMYSSSFLPKYENLSFSPSNSIISNVKFRPLNTSVSYSNLSTGIVEVSILL